MPFLCQQWITPTANGVLTQIFHRYHCLVELHSRVALHNVTHCVLFRTASPYACIPLYTYHVGFREGESSFAKHREVFSNVVMATAKLLVTAGNGIAVSLSLSLSRLLSVMLLASYFTRWQERTRNSANRWRTATGVYTVHCKANIYLVKFRFNQEW